MGVTWRHKEGGGQPNRPHDRGKKGVSRPGGVSNGRPCGGEAPYDNRRRKGSTGTEAGVIPATAGPIPCRRARMLLYRPDRRGGRNKTTKETNDGRRGPGDRSPRRHSSLSGINTSFPVTAVPCGTRPCYMSTAHPRRCRAEHHGFFLGRAVMALSVATAARGGLSATSVPLKNPPPRRVNNSFEPDLSQVGITLTPCK